MSKSKIFVTVVLLLSFFCLFITNIFAGSNRIQWSQKKLEISGKSGDSFSIDVQFESRRPLSDVSLWVIPRLQPFISFSPTDFETVDSGTAYSVKINVSIPYNTEEGLYKGTIHLRKKHEKHKGRGDDDSSDDRKNKKKKKLKKHHEDGSSDDKYEKRKHKHKEKHKGSHDDKSSDDGSSDDKHEKHKHGFRTIPDTLKIKLIVDNPPLITITSPETLTTVGSSPITVTGTVDDSDAIVTVNGATATVNDNTYTATGITLTEGGNTITTTAIDEDNKVGTAHATIYLDSTPPIVTITSPEDGYVATSSPITVTGIIYDIVKGTVNENNATVEVNGISASVSNKTFMVENLPLVEGENVITATAADQTGNTAGTSIGVTLDLSANKKINMVSGNNQTGTVNTPLPEPLAVSLTNADGTPAVGKTVIFKIIQNNGLLTGSGPASSLAEVTDVNGEASVFLALGSTSGVGNNKVEATSVGFTGKVIFTASAAEKPPHKINIGSGNNQRGAVNAPLPNPLVAVVTDEGHNVIQGVPVTFTVLGGGGNIDGSSSVVVNTDSDGRATVSFTLGPEEGLDNNVLQANFEGNNTGAAVFRASGLSVGDPGDTSISGIVLDNSNIPIPGVTMRVEGTTREVVTDDEGQFLIENVPVGPLHLIADGSTVTVGEFPVLSFEIDTVAGQNNTLGMPIYLLPLNTENTRWVGGGEDVVYELENIPGFSLTVKANSVTFPDGSIDGFISVTQVHADKVPMEPPNGLQPRFIITIQPPGAVFDPPAPITIPNVDGLPPGEITEMYSFDHDLGQFVSIGTGTVSENGMVIASDPGVGIIKAGWHCGGNPAQSGCTHVCGACKKCVRNCECVADDTNTAGLGECEECQNGQKVSSSEGSTCDDGKYCTSFDGNEPGPDYCTGSGCKGNEITNKQIGQLAYPLEINELAKSISTFLSWFGVSFIPEAISASLTLERILHCCEEKTTIVENRSGKGGVDVKVSDLKGKLLGVPLPKFVTDYVDLGIYAVFGVNIGGSFGVEKDNCKDKLCWSGGGSVGASGGVEGAATVESIVEIKLSGTTGVTSPINVTCTDACLSLNWDGLKADITAEFFDGVIKEELSWQLMEPTEIGEKCLTLGDV